MPIVDSAVQHAGAVAAAWLLTYLVHSTILIGTVGAASRWLVRRMAVKDVLWKVALFGGVATATLQVGLALEPSPVSGVRAVGSALPAPVLMVPAAVPPPAALPMGAPASHRWQPELPAGWPLWLAGSWAALAMLRLLALARARRALFSRLAPRRAVRGVEGVLETLRRSARFHSEVRLTASSGLLTPVAIGRREICVPAERFARYTPEQQESILAHELAHLVRRDPFWFTASAVVRAALFVQPLNTLAQRRLKHTAEFLCDDAAVAQTGKHRPLVECLAHLATVVSHVERIPLPAMAEADSPLLLRVRRVLDPGRERDVPLTAGVKLALAGGICAVMAVLAPGFAAPPARPHAATPHSQPDLATLVAPAHVPAPPPAAPLPPATVPASPAAAPARRAPSSDTVPATGAKARDVPAPAPAGATSLPAEQPELDPRFLALEMNSTHWDDGVVVGVSRITSRAVRVTRSPRRVVGVDAGGALVATRQLGDRISELRVTRGSDGMPAFAYTVDGRDQPFGDDARAWLSDILSGRFSAP